MSEFGKGARQQGSRSVFVSLACVACLLAGGAAWAQPELRVATNVRALLAFPSFYHLRAIVVRGEVSTVKDRTVLLSPSGERSVDVVFRGGRSASGLVELRGVFWDVGRMSENDPQFGGFDIQSFLNNRTGGAWPKPGDLLVVCADSAFPAVVPPAPSVRAAVLDPTRYEDQQITVSGEFRGSNLYGDLPRAPTSGRWDFVLRSANAAVWVTGLRPRGHGFDLDPHAKVDTGRVLEVSGTVKTRDGLVWLVADDITAPSATAVLPREEAPTADRVPPPPPMPPPSVIFSLPADGETGVSPASPIRIQLSRNVDPATFPDQIRAGYPGGTAQGAAKSPAIAFTTSYNAGDRIIGIHWAKPLEPYRMVKVELLGGIKGTDGQALVPWTLTFTTRSQ